MKMTVEQTACSEVEITMLPPESTLENGSPTDTEMLDWLNRQKQEHHAHWLEDGWQDPSASWGISTHERCGTYEFPTTLKSIDIRTAIRAAMSP